MGANGGLGKKRVPEVTSLHNNFYSLLPLAPRIFLPLLSSHLSSLISSPFNKSYGIELIEGDGHEVTLLGAGTATSSSSSLPSAAAPGGAGAGGADGAGGGPYLGRVLALHCGHNNAYADGERRMLLEHLALQG